MNGTETTSIPNGETLCGPFPTIYKHVTQKAQRTSLDLSLNLIWTNIVTLVWLSHTGSVTEWWFPPFPHMA